MPLNSNKEQKKEIKRARYYEMDKKKIPRLEMQMRINRSKQPEPPTSDFFEEVEDRPLDFEEE